MIERLAGEQEAAADVATYLRKRTARLPAGSAVRSLALESAGHWTQIAGSKRRRHLAAAELAAFLDPSDQELEVPVDGDHPAVVISRVMREQAARMPLDSPERSLALRGCDRWATIAGCQPVRLTLEVGGADDNH